MKTRRIFLILAGLMICSMFSTSQGADKFYYGAYGAHDTTKDFSYMKDSLRFNINYSAGGVNSSTIHHWKNNKLRLIVCNRSDANSPARWAYESHYTLWEAEGLDQSWVNLEYDGGTLVNDGSASGGKAMKFTGPGTPRLIQTGPTYYQEPEVPDVGIPIKYTAEFRLKFRYSLYQPRGPVAPGPSPTPVCSIMVVDTVSHSILKDTVLYKSDFPTGGIGPYQTFELKDYTVPGWNQIEFQIYWFGIAGDLYIDYVKVYDEDGKWLMSGFRDSAITAYVSQDWVHETIPETGETVVYRWYLRDEPRTIDLFATNRYIDSLLRVVSTERVGFQAFCRYGDDSFEHEYFLRQNPEEYNVDIYPTPWWGPDFSGGYFQQGVSKLTRYLNESKQEAENREKDFWVTIQTFVYGLELLGGESCSPGCSLYYEYLDHGPWYCCATWKRSPTSYEVRLQTFLALCYGADALLHWPYYSRNGWNEDHQRYEILLGLYDHLADTPTGMWREIKEFTGPRVETVGPVLNQLTWQGACSDDSVGSFILRNGDPSYIRNIVSYNHYPPYVEVGFFDDGDDDYFMLVNRRCLSSEGDSFRVFLETDTTGAYFLVEDMYDGSYTWIDYCDYNTDFTVYLRPGEGRLFKFFVTGWQTSHIIHVPSEQCSTIQAGIDYASQDCQMVLVDTGTYCENIDFNGKNILVTSKFHTTGDTSYISRTIIDGSCPADPESASVVRFVSGEGSYACIKGFTLRNGSGTLFSYKGNPSLDGGGIFCKDSSPTIANNIIVSNTVTGGGGGICCNANSSPRIVNNIIRENTAGAGGGICGGSSQMITANNLILQNTAYENGGGIDLARGIITNNTIDVNEAGSRGGGIYVSGSTQIKNNIITNGYAAGVGGIYTGAYPDIISYNNVWNNIGGNFGSYSHWGDTTWGTNRNGIPCDSFYNIIRNPNFVDGYYLDGSSVCIDAGDNNAPALPSTDFDGNTRVVDGDENGSFFVDMGAYEYQPGGSGGFGKIVGSNREDTETKSSSQVPDEFLLSQNHPNPFNPTTVVEFKIGQPSKVSLTIYNILGQLVRILVDEEKTAGSYTVYWDGNDKNGDPVSSGIYFYKLDAGDFTEVKKMVLIK